MGWRGRDLAARFRAAHSEAETEREAEQKAREASLEEGRRAREDLFTDLEDFAAALGFISVERDEGGVRMKSGDHWLHFEPMGEGERVKVAFEGSEKGQHRLFRIPELGQKWAWSFLRYGREERLLFFDDGLEELAILGLGLERPSESPNVDAEPPRAAAPTESDAPADDDDDAPARKRTL